MGIGVGIGIGVAREVVQPATSLGPPAETLVRSVVGVATVEPMIECTAAVGDLIVIYAAGTVPECFDFLPEFRASWNGLPFTVTQVVFSDAQGPSGEPVSDLAIATLLVPAGKAGTFDALWNWHDQVMETVSAYVERWAGVVSATADHAVVAFGLDNSPGTALSTPTVDHALVLCAIAHVTPPAQEGSWPAALTDGGHTDQSPHFSTAYEIQTTATPRGASKSNISSGQWGAITVMMRAE
jgi:hypothetical protein